MREISVIFILCCSFLLNAQFIRHTLDADYSSVDAGEIADMDGDGDMDIVFEHLSLRIFEQTDINQNEWNDHLIPGSGGLLKLVDLDGDGDIDITSRRGGRLVCVENVNPSMLEFQPHFAVDLPNDNIKRTELADIDGDGDLDFITDSMSWVENVDGRFDFEGEYLIYDLPAHHTMSFDINLVDFDQDADIDIIFNVEVDDNKSQVKLIENLGSGNFSEPTILIDSFDGWWLAFTRVIDVDNDQDFDVVIHNGPDDIVWFRNDAGAFSESIFIHEYLDVPADLEVVDIDGDGLLDVAWCGHGGVFWKLNQGDFTFLEEAEYLGPDEPNKATVEITFGDLDQDDDLDLLRMGTSIGSFSQEFRWYENTYPPIVPTIDQTKALVKVFPNPFEDVVTIAGDYEHTELYDLQGRLVSYQTDHQLEIGHLYPSVYMLHIYFGDGTSQVSKLTKTGN